MRLRFPIPVAVLAGAVGIGAISIAGAQAPTLQPAANPQVAYTVTLTGANEVAPNVGDPDGTGTANVTVNSTTGQVCVNITTTNTEPMTLMHIHTGDSVTNGPVFVDFAPPSGTVTSLAKCVTDAPAKAAAINANPAGHYLNVHSATFPAGAIRGQLAPRVLAPAELRLLDEPTRAYDSRGTTDGKLIVGTPRVVDLSASAPITARAALITLTVTQTVGGGFVTAYSNALTVAPATSTVNWTAPNSDVATTTTVAVDGADKIALLAGQNGTHVIVDVIGYYV
jgi:hypothetical protein